MAAQPERPATAPGGDAESRLAAAVARFPPRWLTWLLIPGLIGPVLILVFIFVSELAHDESRCGYTQASTQPLPNGLHVREDARSCLPGIEERRYTLIRPSGERVLGRRRFRASAFAPDAYGWKASLSAQDEARVDVTNKGHANATFREGTPAEDYK